MYKPKRIIQPVISASLLLLSSAGGAQAGNLTIDAQQIRNNNGKLQVAVFDQQKAFKQSTIQHAYAAYSLKINNQSATITLHNLPEGSYAVSLFHDENGNDDMDTGITGIPKEGYGTSNAQDEYAEPSFAEAGVKMGRADKTIEIKLHYLVK